MAAFVLTLRGTNVPGKARVESLGLSADAAWLTVATPTGIAVIERASGRVAHTFEADLHHVQWDPERGDRFAFTTREQVALISIGQGAPRRQVFPVDGFATIAFSRERICVSDMRGLRLLDEESTTSVEVLVRRPVSASCRIGVAHAA